MDAANAGDHATAYRLFDGILPWVQNMESGSYNQKAKLGLLHQGLPTGPVRQPLLPLEEDTAAELIAALDQALAVSLAPA
jgi:4-hydroxy-tetrahydrodipicolinate synthase